MLGEHVGCVVLGERVSCVVVLEEHVRTCVVVLGERVSCVVVLLKSVRFVNRTQNPQGFDPREPRNNRLESKSCLCLCVCVFVFTKSFYVCSVLLWKINNERLQLRFLLSHVKAHLCGAETFGDGDHGRINTPSVS